MLPPRLVRRLLFAPVLLVLTVALAVLFLPALLVATLISLVFDGRYRAVRLLRFALAWAYAESWAVLACLVVWLGSGLRGRVRAERLWDRHYDIVRRYVAGIYRAAERYLTLRVEVDGEAPDPLPRRPIIVLSRHAGPGDSLILIHHLLTGYGRRPRLVMKDFVQFDPLIDIAVHRLPNVLVRQAGDGMTQDISELAEDLGDRDALVLFPEGGNFTPHRRERAIARLRRLRRRTEAARAARMRHVLPPRPGGALAAIDAAPGADVVFVAHSGLEDFNSVGTVWRGLPLAVQVRAHWWRIPAEDVPRERAAQVDWLFAQWARVDAWIEEARNPARDLDTA
ncbi:hypothetical protein DPM19_18675 [Actinomadura craniellae]|uniref:Phospholipid/glycerol acyltransferase domain-containing protein n=1 Tax=Actinomadura craniellae TaxID=2231787 RepID=A0A365H3L4_9ACTN|nr:1-acyl-sn-glycerol-3-phosphate acyltransferase [Actinomadura craniellae]RAY13690.1 hypothetical protein DPM19_18675 [Actinomadura craniellae]